MRRVAAAFTGGRVRLATATPTSINIARVVAAQEVVTAFGAGRLGAPALAAAERMPEAGPALFALACAAGAGALVVLNGATQALVIGLVMGTAGLGALLRRGLARWLHANSFLQLLAASLLAGLVGAVALRAQVPSPLRLLALGPLLVLVPGPALLNGALDLGAQWLPLGLARVGFGLLTILLLATGVLLGLGLGGPHAAPTAASPPLPLGVDVLLAGVAAAAYSVFFTLPWRLLPYPVLAGMLAHAVRWAGLTHGHLSNAWAAGLACLVAGALLAPLAQRRHLPFAGVGFAAVVSLVPGILLFRLGGGLLRLQQLGATAPPTLVNELLADAATALDTVIAMTLGLGLPRLAYRRWRARRS